MSEAISGNVEPGTKVYNLQGEEFTVIEKGQNGMINVETKDGLAIPLSIASLYYNEPFPEPDVADKPVEFKNSDLGLMAAIAAKYDTPVIRIDESHDTPGKKLFVIKGEHADAFSEYYGGKLQVDALKYYNSMKNIKSMMFNMQK